MPLVSSRLRTVSDLGRSPSGAKTEQCKEEGGDAANPLAFGPNPCLGSRLERGALPRIRRGHSPVDVQDVARALSGARFGAEVQHRLGHVLRKDVDAEDRPLAVVLLELALFDPVRGGPLLAPARVPDP